MDALPQAMAGAMQDRVRIPRLLEDPTSGRIAVDGGRRDVQPVFQDPFGSLDPTKTLERLIDEPLRIARVGDPRSRRAVVQHQAGLVEAEAVVPRRGLESPGERRDGSGELFERDWFGNVDVCS